MLRFLRDITGLETGGGWVAVLCCTVAGAVLLVCLVQEGRGRHGHVLVLAGHLRVTARAGGVPVARVSRVPVPEVLGGAGVPVVVAGGDGGQPLGVARRKPEVLVSLESVLS